MSQFQLDLDQYGRSIPITESGTYYIKVTLSWFLVMKYHVNLKVKNINYQIGIEDTYPLRWDSDNCIARRFWIKNTCDVQIDTNNNSGYDASIFVVPNNDPAAITTALVTVPVNSLTTQSLEPNSYLIKFCAASTTFSSLTAYSLSIYHRNTSQC